MASLESSRLDGQTGAVETEVPQSARWLYCGEPDDRQKAVLGKDCGTRADFRVAVPFPPPHYLELGQSPPLSSRSSVMTAHLCKDTSQSTAQISHSPFSPSTEQSSLSLLPVNDIPSVIL